MSYLRYSPLRSVFAPASEGYGGDGGSGGALDGLGCRRFGRVRRLLVGVASSSGLASGGCAGVGGGAVRRGIWCIELVGWARSQQREAVGREREWRQRGRELAWRAGGRARRGAGVRA